MVSHIQKELHSLESRVTKLERGKGASKFQGLVSLRSLNDKARFIGWAVTVFALAGFMSGWYGLGSFMAISLLFTLTCGLGLIFSASGLIGPSDSVVVLGQQHRALHAPHARATHTHRTDKSFLSAALDQARLAAVILAVIIFTFILGFGVRAVTADVVLQVLPFATAVTIAGVAASAFKSRNGILISILSLSLLLSFAASPFVALTAGIAAFTVLWIINWSSKDLPILSATGFGLLLVVLLQLLSTPSGFNEADLFALTSASCLGALLAVLPYVTQPRSLVHREYGVLAVSLAPAALVVFFTLAGPEHIVVNFLTAIATVSFGCAVLGAIAWMSFGRASYAKYFLTVSLSTIMLFAYLILEPVSLTLIWFVLSLGVLVAGFALPSYTARWFGIGLLGISVLHYLFMVLPGDQVAGPILLQDRVWLGLVVSLFLPLLAYWYEQAALRGQEQRMIPALTGGMVATSLLILSAIAYLDLGRPNQALTWMVLGSATWLFAEQRSFTGLSLLSKALVLVGFCKLFLLDFMHIGVATQLGILFLAALTLLAYGTAKVKWRMTKLS